MTNQGNQPPQNVYYAPPPMVMPTSTLAIISLIAGLLGFFLAPVIGSVIAIITGFLAYQETRSVPPRASGDGMATVGIILGAIQIVLAVLAACCYLIFFLGIFGSIFANQ